MNELSRVTEIDVKEEASLKQSLREKTNDLYQAECRKRDLEIKATLSLGGPKRPAQCLEQMKELRERLTTVLESRG